jgi:hypothetical protein
MFLKSFLIPSVLSKNKTFDEAFLNVPKNIRKWQNHLAIYAPGAYFLISFRCVALFNCGIFEDRLA